jgi:hypothetical protein
MKTTICVCDKCRQQKQLKEVATLTANLTIPNEFSHNSYSRSISNTGEKEKHICKDCLVSLGMFLESEKDGKKEFQKEMNIKDRLYDVLLDLLNDAGVKFEE